MRIALPIQLTAVDRSWLEKSIQSALTPRRLSERCRIILLAADGKRNEQIAALLGYSEDKVGRWRTRFAKAGRAGIEQDAVGRGRKATYPTEIRQLLVRKTTRGRPPGQNPLESYVHGQGHGP